MMLYKFNTPKKKELHMETILHILSKQLENDQDDKKDLTNEEQ